MGLKLLDALILMRSNVGVNVLVLLAVVFVLSSTVVDAQTNVYQGNFTAKISEDGRSFKAPMLTLVEVEKSNVSMGAYAVDDTATEEYSVSLSFTGTYDYKSGKVSGIANGSYDKGAVVDANEGLWSSCIDKGVGTWSGNVDPDTGIGKGSYTINLVTSTYYQPELFVGIFSTYPVTKPCSGTITGTWETKFQISMKDILEWYADFGNSQQTWPDGTVDQKALVGPSNSSYKNNFWASCGYPVYMRYTCTAIQWKTLYFLNQLKRDGKLVGWDYIPVDGWWASGYPVHNTVAIWAHGDKLEDGIILDAHDPNSAWSYNASYVKGGYWGIGKYTGCPWHLQRGDGYDDVYPGFGIVSKYELGNFIYCTEPWNQPGHISSAYTATKSKAASVYSTVKSYVISIKCPVDVLIVNSKGERIGVLPNGEMVLEFEPISIYFWVKDGGEKEWVFSLPDDTYEIQITGTDTGNFHLLTGIPGEYAHDYGNIPTTPGEQAILTFSSEMGEELILADGSKHSFSLITPSLEEARPDVGKPSCEDNQPPSITIASISPSSGPAPLTTSIKAIAFDSDEGITEWRWDFEADGEFDIVEPVDVVRPGEEHSMVRSATFTAHPGTSVRSIVTVVDNCGATASAEAVVNITGASESMDEVTDFDESSGNEIDNAKTWYNKGVAFDNSGMYEKAIECYDKAIEIDSRYALALNNKGADHLSLGNYDNAIGCFDQAVGIDPYYKEAWNNKGVALGYKSKFEDAINCFEKAIEIDMFYREAWNNMGNANYYLGNYDDAVYCYGMATTIDITDIAAWNNKGKALQKLGRNAEAQAAYDKAAELVG